MISKYEQTLRFLRLLADAGPAGLNITISGETGVGKEYVLMQFFAAMGLNSLQYVIYNMAAIQPNLIESELFGYERGAFTGAAIAKPGLFEKPVKFFVLDEITAMPLDCQAKLLRAIEYKEFYRVGGVHPKSHNLTFVSLTNVDLDEAVRSGQLRNDLMYRIADIRVSVPPLRERTDEIKDMFVGFSGGIRPNNDAANMLAKYMWPGNVRQLKSVSVAAALLARATGSSVITPAILIQAHPELVSERLPEAEEFSVALAKCGFDVQRTCKELGISRATFYRKMNAYGIAHEYSDGKAVVSLC